MSFGTGGQHRRWSEWDRAKLRRMAADGVFTRGIARRLGRTALAVRVMACRLGVALRSPVGRPRRDGVAPIAPRQVVRAVGCAFNEARRAAFDLAERAFDVAAGLVRAGGAASRSNASAPVTRRSSWISPHPFQAVVP